MTTLPAATRAPRVFSRSALRSHRSRQVALFLAGSIATLLAIPTAPADTITWNQAAGGDFNTPENWNPMAVPTVGDTALFNIATSDVTLSADASPGSISFDAGATSFALGTVGGNTLTTANTGAISILSTLTAANQSFAINAPLILTPASTTAAGTFTIQNNATSASTTLTVAGGVSSSTTSSTETLTLAGTNTGANLVSGNITNGNATNLAVTKSGAGTWTLSGANSYSGGTSIGAGTLALSGGNNRLLSTGTVSFTGPSGTLDVGSTSQTLGGLNFPTLGTTSNVITGASGTLAVTAGNIQIGGGDASGTSTAQTVSMIGLGTFSYTNAAGSFTVGGTTDFNSPATTGSGTLSLAATNTITAASFNLGLFSTGLSSLNSGTVHLGQTNTINATTIVVGSSKMTGTVDFQNLTTSTLKIRGTAGTDAALAAVTVGTNSSGITAAIGKLDLTNNGTVSSTLDAMLSTLLIGQNSRNLTSAGSASTGTFTMGLGTLSATTIVLGQQAALTGGNTHSGPATATLSLSGGAITATTLTLADKLAAIAPETITSNFNLNSGTLNATTIQRGTAGTGAGANTATINFNWVDGTISNIVAANQTVSGNTAVGGLTGGLNMVLNNTGNISGTHTWNVSGTQTATVQNTVMLSGAGGLTKAGTGTLIFNGANSYAGPTAITSGTVRFATEASLYNGVSSNWTAANLTANSGTTAIFNVGGAGEFTASDLDILKGLGTATGGFKSGAILALDTTNAGGSFSYGGSLTNPNGNVLTVNKLGTGTLLLSGTSYFTGGTNIAAGTLALSGGANRLLSTGTMNFTGTAGTLDVGSTSQTLSSLTFPVTGTNSHVVTGSGGTLTVTGSAFHVGGGSATLGGSDTVDMTGLGTFNYTNSASAFSVGGRADVNGATSAAGTLSLAATNNITATSFIVSPVASGNSSPNTGIVHLGQTNVINATTFTVGVGKATSTLDFQTLVAPTLKIRGTGGTDQDRATLLVGSNDSGATTNTATMNVSGGVLDAMVGTLTIGLNARNNITAGLASTGIFTMGAGTLNATNIVVGQQNAVTASNLSGPATGTLNLNGGTITTTTLTLSNKLSGSAVQSITSNLNLNSGTLNATTITRGTDTAGLINFNWVDGTIGNVARADQSVNGGTASSGLSIALNTAGNLSGTHTWSISGTQTGTIQSTAILTGSGALTKTGTGTLIFAGANTYTGLTTVSAGELDLNVTGGQSIAGNLTVSGGIAKLVQADQINAGKSLVVSGGTFAMQSFNQSLSTVQLTGGSITSTTGVLTSIIYDLRSGTASAILGGIAGVNKTTSGTVVLSGANTFSGGTTVSAGTVIGTSTAALGVNSGLSVAANATFAYRPTAAGALTLGTGGITLADGSTIGTAVSGTLSQSVTTSSVAASASGAVAVNLYGIPGATVTAGTHNLLTAASGLTTGGATYSLTKIFNATNFTVSNFQATNTALTATVTAATALTTAYWKGGLGVGSNVWSLSSGSASNWATDAAGTATPLVPGTGATINFSATTASDQNPMVLGANMTINRLIVSDPNSVTLNADSYALTISNAAGIAVNGGAGAVTLNTPVTLGAAQSWTNNSGNPLTIGGAVTNGGFTLTVAGTGNATISGNLSGTGGLSKTGTGTLTASGTNSFSGTVGVASGGRLILSGDNLSAGALAIGSGTVTIAGGYTGAITVGNVASAAGILKIQTGANLFGTNMAILAGTGSGAGAAGAIYQSGGDVLLNGNLNLGNSGGTAAASAYGFYSLSGGTISDTGSGTVRFRIGGQSSYSTGVFYQTGGTANIAYINGLEVGGNATGGFVNATGAVYLTGGSLTAVANRIGYNSSPSSTGGIRGEETIAGTANVTINGVTTLGQAFVTGNAGDTGILNLNGGTYATKQIVKGNGAGIANFNGGTLKAATGATGGAFLNGLTSANVFSGGLTVDTNGQNLTIGQALLAPAGSGVTTIPVSNAGSGYIGAPLVAISDTTGSGATAVAKMIDDGTGNGTFKIDSIIITSAGTGYSGTPSASLSGGGGTGAALGTSTSAANDSGGLTKTGLGTLTLSNTNTYTGPTAVSAGTLAITGSINATTAVNLTGAILSLGASNVVNDAATIDFGNAGKLSTGGFSEFLGSGNGLGANGTGAGLGTLSLSGDGTIDFGSSASSILWFSGVGTIASGKLLTIENWSGNVSGGGIDQLRFTSDPGALLSQITFTGYGSATEVFFSNVGGQSYYEVMPIPEPSSIALLGGVALLGLVSRRQRTRKLA